MGSIPEPPTARFAWPIPAVYSALALTSLAAAGIHFAVMGEHFDEYFAFGLFFSVVAWFQGLWALGVAVAPTRGLLTAGMVGNAIVVAVWVVSRTTGLPIGPEPGTPEPAAFLDVLSTALEAGIVVAAAALLVRRPPPKARGGTAFLVLPAFALALVVLTTAAVASGGHAVAGHAGEGAAAGDRIASTAELSIVAPRNGKIVHGSTVELRVDLQGARIVPQTTANISPDEGHLHVLLDDQLISMTEGLTQSIPHLAPGLHRLTVEFVASDHAPFDPRVVAVVAFEVKP